MKTNLPEEQNEKKNRKEDYVCPESEILEMECEQLILDTSNTANIGKMTEDTSDWN
jgi:hypothetical protein